MSNIRWLKQTSLSLCNEVIYEKKKKDLLRKRRIAVSVRKTRPKQHRVILHSSLKLHHTFQEKKDECSLEKMLKN